jgi:hypothetical protein
MKACRSCGKDCIDGSENELSYLEAAVCAYCYEHYTTGEFALKKVKT